MTELNASADGGQGASTGAALTGATIATATASDQITSTPTAPATQPINWLNGADETTLGYVQNKGWTEPSQVLDGYRNLEKLLGADKAGNAVIIPKADADPKEWNAIYDRMGRPTGPDGYNVKFPEHTTADFQTGILAKAHELGLTKAQAEGLFGDMTARSEAIVSSMQAARQEAFVRDDAAIRAEWGQAYTQNLAQAQAAARGLGLDAATIDKISEALGHKGTMTLLQQIGVKLGEDTFVTGDKTESFGNAMTPGQAKAEIQSLMGDRNFTTRYMSGDAEAKAKMERLHSFAYPEG